MNGGRPGYMGKKKPDKVKYKLQPFSAWLCGL